MEDRGCVEGFSVAKAMEDKGCRFPINGIGTSLRSGDGNGGDDTADGTRYLVATKERKVTQRKLRDCNHE
jgi:hypothetical protein